MIKSENGRLTAWVLVEPGTDIGRYIPQVKQLLNDKLTLPPGYAIKYAGQYQSWQKGKNQLKTMIPVTLMLIVLLLYLCFQRLLDVAIIMCCVPFSLVGGVWLLYWLGFNFSIAVSVGFIALAGVAIETGVLMVVYLNQSVTGNDCCDRASIGTAVQSAALARARPIVMTAIAVIAGLLPILFGSGIGIRVMERIAAPMIGGMISVMIMTLLVLPAIYILRYRFKHAKHSEITKSIE
jgi:Cu(I)/Ag(I) efflux system membrane protein CusA/SilA